MPKNDGKKAIEILRENYFGKSMSRIVLLNTKLPSLKMAEDETGRLYGESRDRSNFAQDSR